MVTKPLFRVHLLALIAAVSPKSVHAEDRVLPVGSVERVPAVSISLAVGSFESDVKRVVYSPPPGWYIRSHEVKCQKRSGLVSYTVNTVAAGWEWKSSATENGTSRSRVSGGVSSYKFSLGGTGEVEKDAISSGTKSNQASHNAIVVDISAEGGGLFRGGASIDLAVTAELVFLGIDP